MTYAKLLFLVLALSLAGCSREQARQEELKARAEAEHRAGDEAEQAAKRTEDAKARQQETKKGE